MSFTFSGRSRMLLILVTAALAFSVPSEGTVTEKENQAPSIQQPRSNIDKASEQRDVFLPLYEPTAVNIVDLLQHPPTTAAVPRVEPPDEHTSVYKIRGDYDIRMRNIDKTPKTRNNLRETKKKSPEGDVTPHRDNGTVLEDEDDSLPHTRRYTGWERPQRPGGNRRIEMRRRGSARPIPKPENRLHRPRTPRLESGSQPSSESDSGYVPRTRSRRPVLEPDIIDAPRNVRRATRASRRRGGTRPMSGSREPDDTKVPVSTQYKHGVKIVSEPGEPRKPAPLPKQETPAPAPRVKSDKPERKSGQESKDDPISERLEEAMALEPLQLYDRVVDEDTTEAVDESRLVQQSAFESKLSELEKQQDVLNASISFEDAQVPNSNLRFVDGNSNEAREEEDNLSLAARKTPVTSLPRQRNATSQGDIMVDVEDLGFELATSKNISLSKGRVLVPIVDDSFVGDESANITMNVTLTSSRGIVEDTFDEEMANLTLTDATRKRKKYSIASRLTLANETITIERKNATNSTRTKLRAWPTAISLDERKNVSGETNNSYSRIPLPKSRSRRRGAPNAKRVNGTFNMRKNNVTNAGRAEINARFLNRTKSETCGNATRELKTNATLFSWASKSGKKRRTASETRRTTGKSSVTLVNKTTFYDSRNNSKPCINHSSYNPSNCTMVLPKNHPPLQPQADAGELFSKWKYFEDKVVTRLPNATTTPQELNRTVAAIRRFIIQRNVSHHSIDSDYFRKADLLAGPFPPSKKGVSVNFLLYTRVNSTAPIAITNDTKPLQSVPLNATSNLQVVIHDFGQGASERWIKQLKDALLNEGKNNSVLLVGWRRAASRNYWTAAAHVRPVGRKLACLLHRLRDERGLRLRNVHLVGLGLGAHAAGHAAISIIHKLCEKVGRVTGLDVSAPLFEEFGETLNAAVAGYVDLIHTSADFAGGLRGQVAATGHVDYYPGGLLSPPNSCPEAKADVRRDCARALSAELFVRSVRNECAYRSTSCAPWSSRDQCTGCGPRGCGRMGFRSPSANGTGAQFLHTQTREPYCDFKPILAD